MKFKSNIGLKIHNRFDIEVKDANTGEVLQKAQAENIVLDRIYTRLLNFQSYFDQIVFGSGTGTLSASRTTLFTRIGNKAAVTESLVRSYPTSVWTRSIRLGTEEFNGQTIREVGISETTTNINTHALITDSEGNPLSVEKTNLKIIDIYATVFVEVYSVDSGCFFYGNGLRDYLTGGTAPANTLGIGSGSSSPDGYPGATLTATRTSNSGEKSITLTVRFNIEHHNKDVRAIDWVGGGLRWLVPRTGVYTGTDRTNVQLGVGNGSNTKFKIPNTLISNLSVFVDGIANTGYTKEGQYIVFDTAPASDLLVTANYKSIYIPKDSDHVLDVTMKIQFAISQPSPVAPVNPPVLPNDLPGPQTLSGGDITGGYFGEVSAANFISGEELCDLLGLTAGVTQNSEAGWLKYYNENELTYVAKQTFRHTISWNDINAVGAAFGNSVVAIGNHIFACRLLSSAEWNKLIYPVHANYGTWASFSNTELNITGNGGYTWTSTPSSSNRFVRGYSSVEYSNPILPSTANATLGFRPVLVYLYTLPS